MDISPKLAALITAQITRERFASATYLSLASWADKQGFEGLSGWADKSSAEETGHAKRFVDYLRDRGTVMLEAVDAPQADFTNYQQALQATLMLEKTVSRAIGDLYMAAMEAGDGATAKLASEFLTEQVESEKEIETYLLRIGRGSPVDLLDMELFES